MSESEKAAVGKPVNQFPIDLANKATLVKADVKVGTVQGHQTFRTIPSQPHMRVVTMPAGVTSPQIIQTMLPQGILKQTRPINQSITVTKAQGGYIARGPATITSLQTNKAAISSPIRTPTPPASGPVTSLSQAFVRQMTPRTSSPTTTVLSQGATTAWVSGTGAVQVQLPAQLIRSNMQNRTRLVQPGTGNASITNIFNAPTQTGNQTISVSTTSTGQPTFVATVHTPRHQPGATLVYANAQQQFINTPQRIGVTTTNTRQVRPVQRLPTTGIRLNQAALSIRGSLSNNVPILAPTSVMSTTVQARGTVASTSISNTIPARIIQVQSQQGTTNVTANRKIISNVMTVPIIVNNSLGHQVKSQIQTPIAITHSKIDTTTTSAAAGSQPASSSSTIYASSSQGQIITVSQQQIINSTLHQSHLHQQNQPAGAMVRKTLNVTAAGGTVDGRSAANTTILPISKIIQQQNEQQSLATLGLTTSSYQPTSVYIHTRTPTAGTVTSTASSSAQVVHCSTSAAATHFAGGTVYYDHPVSSNSSPVTVTSSSNDKSSTAPNLSQVQFASSPGSFAVVSAASGRQVGHIHGILSNATTQHQTVPVRFNSLADGQSQQTHQIIAMSNSSGVSEQHMIIPMNSSAQVATSPMPSILRKREPEGQPIKLTKKIGNITSVNISNRLRAQLQGQTPPPQTPLQQQQQLVQQQQIQQVLKQAADQASAAAAAKHNVLEQRIQMDTPARRESSDGSTTVSADGDQDHEDIDAMLLSDTIRRSEEAQLANLNVAGPSGINNRKPVNIRNEVPEEHSPRKRAKRPNPSFREAAAALAAAANKTAMVFDEGAGPSSAINDNENSADTNQRKEREIQVKKPPAPTLLQSYKQNWKPANNHFNRYSDVRPRDERRPTVIDLANQPDVLGRINGWKVHHLGSQLEDMVFYETETQGRLNDLLKSFEKLPTSVDTERISDLLKGNIQRQKIIIENVQESRTSLMKVFEHKDHVTDIITRCASKRNFKKRDKM